MNGKHKEYTVVALLGMAVWLWAVEAGGTISVWEQSAWRQTLYYRATFQAVQQETGQLHVAAVDSYIVYLNGFQVGADSTAHRMRAFPVSVVSGANHLAVQVVNRGKGLGNGFMARLLTDSLQVESTTDRSVLAWRWTAVPPVGNAWLTDVAGNDWKPVQKGHIEVDEIAGLSRPAPEVVAGFVAGIDLGSTRGGVTLKRMAGENLALNMPSNRVEVVDGDLRTAWQPPVAALNFAASIDLMERKLIHKVRVITMGPNYADNSLRGYSVQVSDDQLRWAEVGVLHNIEDFERTEVSFTPVWTRHVRIVIVDINAVTQPKVAEVEVFGDGFVRSGTYLSAPLDPGIPGKRKNFGRVEWDATVPERTTMSVQFRTGNQVEDFDASETGWSAELSRGDIWYPAVEPGRFIQYRINMESRDERRTPVFRRLRIESDTEDIPVSSARAWVQPTEALMGEDTVFVYTVDLAFSEGDLGIERLQIAVPSETTLDGAVSEVGDLPVARWHSTRDILAIIFSRPLTDSGRLRFFLRTRTYASVHDFRAFVFSTGSSNPLNVAEENSPDPITGQRRSWNLLTLSASKRTLSQVRANPPVFSPNGDGINDDTVIEFVLTKVDILRPVCIRLFDLHGRTIADLSPPPLSAGSYLRLVHGPSTGSPGVWDGRDATGRLVPPGIYLYRVKVELDSGNEVRTGTVGVVY